MNKYLEFYNNDDYNRLNYLLETRRKIYNIIRNIEDNCKITEYDNQTRNNIAINLNKNKKTFNIFEIFNYVNNLDNYNKEYSYENVINSISNTLINKYTYDIKMIDIEINNLINNISGGQHDRNNT